MTAKTIQIGKSGGETPAPIKHLRPAVDPATLSHRELLSGDFWRKIPAYKDVDEATFLDHKFQMRNTISRVDKLLSAVQDLVPQSFYDDVSEGFRRAPMSVRVSPYLLSSSTGTSLRGSAAHPVHARWLAAAARPPARPGLAARAGRRADARAHAPLSDKALFLALDTCPVYCRFCTRSYAVGSTPRASRRSRSSRTSSAGTRRSSTSLSGRRSRTSWSRAETRTTCAPSNSRKSARPCSTCRNIRRIRFATKGPAVMPQKILTDPEWVDALTGLPSTDASCTRKSCCTRTSTIPTRSPAMTRGAMNLLFERGIKVRNQTRAAAAGSTTPSATMRVLVRRLSYCNVQPYYVYLHDLVQGRGGPAHDGCRPAGHRKARARRRPASTRRPSSVDAPGGGGKRQSPLV